MCVYIYIYKNIYTPPSTPSLTLLIKDLDMIYLKNSNSSECLKIDLNLNTLFKNVNTHSDSFGIKYGDINNGNKVHDKFIYNK